MDITPYYNDARNALTQPEKMVFVSQYFRRCWMPALGPLGTAIVIYLRGACYHNRKSGETRDTVQIAQREIATGCGCSVPTIKRELERNDTLRRFIQISPEWERDGVSGRVRQLENHYKVAMDDPLTEADEARLKEMVQERISQEQQAHSRRGERPRKPIRLKEAATAERAGITACSNASPLSVSDAKLNECRNAVNTAFSNASITEQCEEIGAVRAPVDQNELLRPAAHFESPPIQNELLFNESLLKTTNEQTLNVSQRVNHIDSREEPLALPSNPRLGNGIQAGLSIQAQKLVEELHDWGSERRHKQLLSICEQHGLLPLVSQALQATRHRLAQETKRGVLEKPGAYYQSILVSLLEGHQVFLPSVADLGVDDPQEVRRLARASLGLSPVEEQATTEQ